MIDRNSQFMAILTNVGAAKLANANALGIPWNLTELGVGDANGADPMPSAAQTKLINEQRRAPLNQLRVDPVNAAVIIAEQVIPADVGGWWIREIGLYDSDGDLVAVSNCAPSFKPALDQGSGRTQIVRMNFIVSSINNIVLKIDPAIVLATREYVDLAITEAINKQDSKHSVLVATTANIALNGIQTIDGVLLAADARVLVKDQAQAKDNGIYVVPANGAWRRAQDADAGVEVTPGLFVSVEKGTANGDSVWQLVTDAPIVLGTTALTFEVVAGRTGIVAGTYRSLTVDKLGRVTAGTNPTTLAGAGITDAMPIGAGGLMTSAPMVAGAISNLPVTQFFAASEGNSTDIPAGMTYAVGMHIKYPGAVGAYSLDIVSSVTAEDFRIRYTGAGGPAAYRKLWHSGNFEPSTVVPKTGAVMSGPIVLDNGTEDTPEFGFKTPSAEVYIDIYNKSFRVFAKSGGVASTPFLIDLENKGAAVFGNALWTAANFKPSDYIKKGESVLNGSNPVFQSAGFGAISAIPGGAGSFQVSGGDAPSSAVMCFHRPGSYGVMFGLDTDNQLKLGGWSAGAVAHTIWHSGNRPKDTALLAASGWSKNSDTGEIKQWVEVAVDDISSTKTLSVSWPFQFPNSFLNAQITFRVPSNIGCTCAGSYHSATTSGCMIKVEEWASILQTGMVAIVEARGY
ncbi:Phage tail-collar fibre protein [Pseudomonas grimontii]|uniref:Phage tail-collar fibre protein n=1 Tax=Pseudomonas grimontii TaxID=129847 RepID=A0ABY0TU18_9PSED|nr:phage tail protein [Pseudomonas grimontii]SDR37119.1 Phage tail-collar fibre protein [Pseudomonas grimontii]